LTGSSPSATRPLLRVLVVVAVAIALIMLRITVSDTLTPLLLLPILLAGVWFGPPGGALTGAAALLLVLLCDELRVLNASRHALGSDFAGLIPYAAAGYLIGRIARARRREAEYERQDLLARERQARAAAERDQRLARKLAADALETEQTVRRRISESLHDDAIQALLAAAQDLKEAGQGEAGSLARAASAVDQTIARLRDAVFELHPVALEHGGLEAALKAIAQHQGHRGRFQARIRVAPDAAGIHDLLIVAIARELLTNVAKHADASEVLISVARTKNHVFLQVSDDGRGMHAGKRRAALESGHIGLVSCTERAAAAGGSLDVISGPGEGTVVRVLLPSEPLSEDASDASAPFPRPGQVASRGRSGSWPAMAG
jgi:signal transduction histidine kinase